MTGPDAILEMPALGRPFQLGMLYDCFRDTLLSEHSLLDPETCLKNPETTRQTSHTTQKVSSDTIGEKAAALEIPPSLMTSILCDLFEVNGAAKYLLSTKKSKYQEKVTYKYLATERVEQLILDSLRTKGVVLHTIPKNYKASHVVTAVWYGDLGFLDYDKEISTLENIEKKIRSPEAMLFMQGETGLEVHERGKAQDLVFCSMHFGHSSLESSPVTLQDAGQIHSSLPKLLGQSREINVPVKVRLYPLMNLGLGDSGMQLLMPFHEISEALNSDIQHMMEDLTEVEIQAKDLLKDSAVITFHEIRKKIEHFKDLCCQYKRAFQKQLKETVLLVREGLRDEKDLEEVLERTRKSLFDAKGLNECFRAKEREIAFLKSLLFILKDVEIICPKKLEDKVLDSRNNFVVAFLFTSLHQGEPCLSKLEAHLSSPGQLDDSGFERPSSPSWFEDKALITRAREAARSFAAFVSANPSQAKTQFVVASIPDDNNPGASIYLYENGDLRETRFEPPSRPLPIEIGEISTDNVQLRLTPGKFGAGAICYFQVKYRVVGQENWVVEETNGREEVAIVRRLSPDTEYEFCCVAVSKPGLSESSEVSSPVKTLLHSCCSTPQAADRGSPVVTENTNFRMSERNKHYVKETKTGNEEGGRKCNQQSRGQETDTMRWLQALSSALSPDSLATTGSGTQGEPRNIASSLCRTSRRVRDGHPSVYALPLQKSLCNAWLPWPKYSLGKESCRLHHKVILLLGETGAGKSTLIDTMINYALGVQWEDDFRFTVGQDMPKRSQAVSQTETLTVYEINLVQGLQVPYSLTLIDTPGFGNTRGSQYDRSLLEEIQEFFLTKQGVDHIDAICMVVQASQPRLTQSQKYIFDSMLSIFGENIQENIQVLITFADGQVAPVLEAMRASHVPCARDVKGDPVHFSVNSSALFSSNVRETGEDSYHLNQMCWQMVVSSLSKFFGSLGGLEPQSLTTTAEVLRKRKELEADVEGTKPQIKMPPMKEVERKKMQGAMARHRGKNTTWWN